MRTSLPVTDVENPITDEALIVFKTDLNGSRTYFNDQFASASPRPRSWLGVLRSEGGFHPAQFPLARRSTPRRRQPAWPSSRCRC